MGTKERISSSDEAPVVDEKLDAYVFRRTDVAPEMKEEIPTSDEDKDEIVDEKIEEKIAESVNVAVAEVKNDGNDSSLMQELSIRRQQVSAYMMMESGYNSELFTSITLTNDLLVTMKDMLMKMDKNVMKQMYEKKSKIFGEFGA